VDTDGIFGLGKLVEHQARSRADDIAIDSVESGPHSWIELHRAAAGWAGGLVATDIGPGDLVLTMLPTGFEAVVAWVCAAQVGAVEVPLNHAYKGTWLTDVIGHLRARVAVIDRRFWDQWQPALAGSTLEVVVVAGVGDAPDYSGPGPRVVSLGTWCAEGHAPGVIYEPRLDDLACLVHTSGTTGPSKGVMLPWSAFQFRARQAVVPPSLLSSPSVYFVPSGSFHMSARRPWYLAAVEGLRVVTRDGFKTDTWLDDIRRHGVNTAALVGAMGPFIMQTPARPNDADNPLEAVLMGPIPPNVDEFKERFGVEVVASYAMTEIPWVVLTRDGHVVSNDTYRSCGRPSPEVPVRIVNAAGSDAAAGELGELWVGGDRTIVNAGYYGRPAETAEAWRDGWFHTGDLFTFDEEGRYYFVDRSKDAIRRRGENISSVEVENVVNTHPDVAESAVVGIPSEWSEDEVKVCIVPKAGRTVDPAGLIAYCEPRMASFALPRYVEIVPSLPRTPNTKVRKTQLREIGVSPETWDRLAVANGGTARAYGVAEDLPDRDGANR
jgi:carnitine-CoA ligase